MFSDDKWRLDKAAAGCENNAKRIEELEKIVEDLKDKIHTLEMRIDNLTGNTDY
jgi:outer membrane murein-binding lipoprotein Lpp